MIYFNDIGKQKNVEKITGGEEEGKNTLVILGYIHKKQIILFFKFSK